MSAGQRALRPGVAESTDLDEIVRSFPSILENLGRSYAELQSRAERVERELSRANAENAEMIERLHAADKMAALGTMAAGIAHEIRNPLNAVKGFAALLQRRADLDEECIRWCKLIVDGAAEADTIIENMLSFGSPQRLRLETIDGRELIEGALRTALSAEGCDPSVSVRTRCDVPPFLGDRIKLRQALRNLIVNAVEAQEAEPRVEVSLALEGDDVVARVADAGPGVPAELRHRIFDPFFTSYADGTGLGLALVAAIARLHGGAVLVSPEPSILGGAEFLLRFPCQQAPSPAGDPTTLRPS